MLLFHLACKWLEHKKERLKLSKKLLECVRLAHLTPDHLKEVSAHQLVSKDDKCLQRVLIAEEYLKDELAKPLYPEDLHTPRGDLEFVFIEVTDQDEHLRFSCYNNRDLRSTRDITPYWSRYYAAECKVSTCGTFWCTCWESYQVQVTMIMWCFGATETGTLTSV